MTRIALGERIRAIGLHMLALDEAIRLLDEHVKPLPPAPVEMADAIGCRLAEPMHAILDLPRADVSVMDGYAVRASDVRGDPLPVAFEVAAGAPASELPPGHAARIFTGAELPIGADAVIPQEEAAREGDRVRLSQCEPGDFVRRRAEILGVGDELAAPGVVLTPQLISLLAAAGPPKLTVIPRPRLAIVTTGSELVSTSDAPGPGRIRDSNAAMLLALAQGTHLPPRMFERIPDNYESLLNGMLAALERAELVVTSGGVAVGDYDLIPRIITDLNAKILFRKLAIKPGKPILVAHVGSKWLVCLPGNPLSTLVGWLLIVRPMVNRLAGDAGFGEPEQWGQLSEVVQNRGDRLTLACAVADFSSPAPAVRLLKWKGSHDVLALSQANVLAEIPIGSQLRPGDPVRLHRVQLEL